MASKKGIFSIEKLRGAAPLLFILILTCGLYANTIDNELTFWDDNRYVTDNPRVKDLSIKGVLSIFNPMDIIEAPDILLTEYLPVTTLVHAVAYRFSGTDPQAYHVANLFFYLIDLVLLYLLVTILVSDSLVAFLTTLVFAVLPVHVESVTWVSATKDVVSLAFLLVSTILYIRYVRGEGKKTLLYILSLAAFTLAMLSKTLVVTLPILLLLYDLCFERRIRILDKIPYFIIGAGLSLLYIKVNTQYTDTVYLTTGIGPWRLLLTNLTVLKDYLGMLLAPISLNVFYTYTPEDIPSSIVNAEVVFSAIVVGAVAAYGAAAYFLRNRLVTFCVSWFFAAFLPAINLIPSSTLKADRYLFIPSIGFSLLIGWGVVRLGKMGPLPGRILAVVFIGWVLFLSAFTVERNGDWENGITIWKDSLAKYPETARPHFIIGNELRHRSRIDEAIAEYEAALRIDPGHVDACNNLGASYGMRGLVLDAARVLEKCTDLDPGNLTTRVNLARAYIAIGKTELALPHLREVLEKDPDNAAAIRLVRELE